MELFDAIAKRRTVRRFLQTPVKEETLEKLIDCARRAASATNAQPLRYITVRHDSVREAVFRHTRYGGSVQPRRNPVWGQTSPTAFLAVVAPRALAANGPCLADAGAAIQTMTFAALGLGLGSCWIGAFDRAAVEEILELDPKYTVLYLLALGHPGESPVMEDVPSPDKTRYYLDDSDVLHVPKLTVNALLLKRL